MKLHEPYTPSRPIPTVQKHREERENLDSTLEKEEDGERGNGKEGEGTIRTAGNAVKGVLGVSNDTKTGKGFSASENRNAISNADGYPPPSEKGNGSQSNPAPAGQKGDTDESPSNEDQKSNNNVQPEPEPGVDAPDARAKRKAMKHAKRDDSGREVTDPVTHLPIIIQDATNKDLKNAPKNQPSAGTDHEGHTSPSGVSKSESQLEQEGQEQRALSQNMHKLFPPPNFDEARERLMKIFQLATAVGIGSVLSCAVLVLVATRVLSLPGLDNQRVSSGQWQGVFFPISVAILFSLLFGGLVVWVVSDWLKKKVGEVWDDQVWDADRVHETQEIEDRDKIPESTQWLNSLLATVWPLINPDLFTGLADTLEDVMQASLPKMVRMISVDDLGQGSEALRILGVRWLPTGAASGSVDARGHVKEKNNSAGDAGSGKEDSKDGNRPDEEADQQHEDGAEQGMQAEEGDFVNMEIAFAYRARSSGKSLRTKSKNAHLFLKFYMPGSIAVPVWVEMRGVVGTMRLRLQLTPDPPFVALATITFLGQPKADLSCLPLSKHSLNIMDVPLISSFVQSCIDAALAEYVAPRSLTLDLKAMLVGDDFKNDTTAHGVVVVRVRKASGFKEGDGSLGPLKDGSSDAYVTSGWGKFGKPVASTRIILSEQKPVWEEIAYAIVSDQELNAEEMLRLQVWDSDRTSADDDLGRVEVDLKDLMRNPKTRNQMCDREDRFRGPDGQEKMPGTLFWGVGYFAKAHITPEQLSMQTQEPEVKSTNDLKRLADESAERKLREASVKGESSEMAQQKEQDYKEREDRLITSSPPPRKFPSGILSMQIHEITGLELQQLNKKRAKKTTVSEWDGEEGGSDDLPSAYCTFILNHTMVFRTRTKPKNAKPFFNAGCERFIRDWGSTELIISVRDSRVHENNPLLGVVYLSLPRVFEKRSQMVEVFPLMGGIGYGRARVSLVFRSVELQAPKELLGWDYGTLEITRVEAGHSFPDDLKNTKAKFSSSIASSKMVPDKNQDDGNGEEKSKANQTWKPKHHHDAIYLPFKKRYSTPLMVEFYGSSMLLDKTPAFSAFWLKDIADEEERTIKMPVWKGSKEALKRGRSCAEYNGMDEGDEPVGELDVTMKFWRGLSGYHTHLAGKTNETNLRNVMEVLDSANDNKEGKGGRGKDEDGDDSQSMLDESAANEMDTSSSSSSSDFESDSGSTRVPDSQHHHHRNNNQKGSNSNATSTSRRHLDTVKSKLTDAVGGHDDPDDGKRTPAAQFQDYRHHRKALHRRHRGLMQWKGVRTVDWMAGKADRGRDRLTGLFKHEGKGIGGGGGQGELQTEA